MFKLSRRAYAAMASPLAVAVMATGFMVPAHATPVHRSADITIVTGGDPNQVPDYSGAVYASLTDDSGIDTIGVHYSWDNYVHIEQLPSGNDVQILESFTCVNLGTCKDFISGTGTGDNPGTENQPHVSIHRNTTLTFYPTGTGHTVVDEHYEHGIITWLDVTMNDGQEYYIFMTPTPDQTSPGVENPDGLPHVSEFYLHMGAADNTAVYGTDNS